MATTAVETPGAHRTDQHFRGRVSRRQPFLRMNMYATTSQPAITYDMMAFSQVIQTCIMVGKGPIQVQISWCPVDLSSRPPTTSWRGGRRKGARVRLLPEGRQMLPRPTLDPACGGFQHAVAANIGNAKSDALATCTLSNLEQRKIGLTIYCFLIVPFPHV